MFQTVIAVLMGMSFLYFVLAVLCSGAKEFLAAKYDSRANFLEKAIGRMLGNSPSAALTSPAPTPTASASLSLTNPAPVNPGPTPATGSNAVTTQDLASAFYSHPLIKSLGAENQKPSYIPARYFSTVLEQILKSQQPNSTDKAPQPGTTDYAALIRNLHEGQLKQTLSALIDRAGSEAEAIRKEIEIWFERSMDHVSGWYKRFAQKIMLVIAFVLVCALNADSFAVFRALWQNPALRDRVILAAQQAKPNPTVAEANQQLKDLGNISDYWPLGWIPSKVKEMTPLDWVIKFFGLSLTAFAVMLGAPFWFQAMSKLMNLRLTGSPPTQVAPPQQAAPTTVVVQTQDPRAQVAKA